MSEKRRIVLFIIVAIAATGGLFIFDALASKGMCEVMIDERYPDCSIASRIDYITSYPVESVVMGVRAIFLGIIASVFVTVVVDKTSQ